MDIKDPSKYFATMRADVRNALEKEVPKVIGNRLVRAFKENFQNESFFGQPWKDVKRRTNPTKKQAKSVDSRRKILTGRSGDLGRSIQFKISGGTVTIISDLPYSAAHNEGTHTAGRGNHTTIPKRQFMGDHPEVQRIINEEINKAIHKAIQK